MSFENLHAAYRKARRGKRSRPAVARFSLELENKLVSIGAGVGVLHLGAGALPLPSCTDAKDDSQDLPPIWR